MLPLAVGKATKLLPLLGDGRKRYIFELMLGSRTDTADASGQVIEQTAVRPGWERVLDGVAAALIGQLSQLPPMHSARKVDGRPLYEAARKGVDVVRVPRTVEIDELEVLGRDVDRARLMVVCSAGTYVRTLCEELGRRVGIAAHMGALLRVTAGPFRLRDAVPPHTIDVDPTSCLVDPRAVITAPSVELDGRGARRFVHGGEVRLGDQPQTRSAGSIPTRPDTASVTVLAVNDRVLIGYGELAVHDGETMLIPVHVFSDTQAE